MVTNSTDYYDLYFYDTYVIAEARENVVVDGAITENAVKLILDHYNGRPFTLISLRNNKYMIREDAYSPKIFKKLKGMAVVSKRPEVKEKAFREQLQFENSFAFFENLEDAISWAQSINPVPQGKL